MDKENHFAKILCGLLAPSHGEIVEGSNVQLSYYAQNQSDLLDLKNHHGSDGRQGIYRR